MRKLLVLLLVLLSFSAWSQAIVLGEKAYGEEVYISSDGDDEVIIPEGSKAKYVSIINGSTIHVSTGEVWLSYATTVSTTAVGSVSFTGSGLDDATSSGTFTSNYKMTYRVTIDSAGTVDTFKWSEDDGATWKRTGVAITGDVQELSNGVKIKFLAVTGHTSTDYWKIVAGTTSGTQSWPTVGTPTDDNPVLFDYIEIGQSSDIPASIRSIKLKCDTGKIAYVRFRLIY